MPHAEDKMSRFSGTRTFILLLRSLAERAHSRLNGGVDEWNDKHLAPLELEAAEQLFDWKVIWRRVLSWVEEA